MYKSQGVLIIVAVMRRGKGSLIEVVLFHAEKDARP
jgi:hypothetical protein